MDHDSIIERSNERGKFSEADLRAKVRESRAYWSSPAGKARQAKLDREARNRKPPGRSAADERRYWENRLAVLDRSAPKI